MKEIKNQLLMICGKPTKNGRTYSKKIMKEAIKDCSEFGGIAIKNEIDDSLSLMKASHSISNVRIDGNAVFCDVTILDTPCGLFVQNHIKEGMSLIPVGKGIVNKKGKVTEYKLNRIDICMSEDCSIAESRIIG